MGECRCRTGTADRGLWQSAGFGRRLAGWLWDASDPPHPRRRTKPDHRRIDFGSSVRSTASVGRRGRPGDACRRSRGSLDSRSGRLPGSGRVGHQWRPNLHLWRTRRRGFFALRARLGAAPQRYQGPADRQAAAPARRSGQDQWFASLRRRCAASRHAVRFGPAGTARRQAEQLFERRLAQCPPCRGDRILDRGRRRPVERRRTRTPFR